MDIEKNIIGAMVKFPSSITISYQIVKPGDFLDKRAGFIYDTIINMVKDDEAIDITTVSRKLIGKVDLAWLADASDNAISSGMVKHHAKLIANDGRKRRLQAKIKSLAGNISDPEKALSDILAIYTSETTGDKKSPDIKDVVNRFKKLIEDNSKDEYGLDTGYQFLNDKFIKYMPGHIWIIGAWTSVGKTATMVDMICRVLQAHDPAIAIISTEMMEEQNVARFLANRTGYHSQVMLSGKLHSSRTGEMYESLKWFSERKIYLYDDLYSLQDVEMSLRQLTMRQKIDIVFIDYIQNMTYDGAKSEYESKSEIAKGLQRIAKQLNVCIVCLSQIPNSAIKEDSDILEYKGAGEIAAVADVGIRLKRDQDAKDQLLFIVGKNRHGQLCQNVLKFVNNFTMLYEIKNHIYNSE